MSRGIDDHEGKKYLRLIHSAHPENTRLPISVDIYAVLEAFGVTCPARAHCIKKLLACGNRGKGSELDDLIGADAALSRAIELQRQRELIASNPEESRKHEERINSLLKTDEDEEGTWTRDKRVPLSVHKEELIGFMKLHGNVTRQDIVNGTTIPQGSISELLSGEEFQQVRRGLWTLREPNEELPPKSYPGSFHGMDRGT